MCFINYADYIGPPGKIVNFDGNNISSTTIVLTWDPPSHLPHLKPCCLHYYVNITHLNTSDIIHDSNITSTNVNFTIKPERLCDVYIATIGGYNQVGLGDIFVQGWSLGGKGFYLGILKPYQDSDKCHYLSLNFVVKITKSTH